MFKSKDDGSLIFTQGDTGTLDYMVNNTTSLSASDMALLTIAKQNGDIVLQKTSAFSLSLLGGRMTRFNFTNAETANIPVGIYKLEVRVVKTPVVENDVIVDGAKIVTFFENPTIVQVVKPIGHIGAVEEE